jgi:hypothetical protein
MSWGKKCALGLWLLVAVSLAGAAAVVVTTRVPFSYDLQKVGLDTGTRDRLSATNGWQARLGELVLPLLDPGDTEYADGFSQEAFDDIVIGSTEEDVLSRLGKPLQKRNFPDGTTVWHYTRHGKRSKSFFIRALEFDENGCVRRRWRRYYVD